ncbi:GntR family transcriptional regulator [Jonesia quinghaiensis]|uniref:GntR family transcriptional regulator n=1 Tax=Jonesia quinghaiensis TaxID=262806 RepID=UPI000413D1BA|nr:GntR family transcriptional regulator [Jonesia quinghaiensis]
MNQSVPPRDHTTLPWETLDTPGGKSQPIAQHIAAHTAQRIVERHYREGDLLTEVELAAQHGASRTPAREAMLQLQRWGLVRIAPKKGATVTALTPNDVLDLIAVRVMFETQAVTRLTDQPHELETLGHDLTILLDRQEASTNTTDALAFAADDYRFHARIIRSSGNTVITGMLDNLAPRLARLTYQAVLANPHLITTFLTEHHTLAQLAQQGNATAFGELATRHLHNAHFPTTPPQPTDAP